MTTKEIEAIQDEMTLYGMELTMEQVKAILDENPQIKRDIYDCGVDTVVREEMADAVARYAGLPDLYHWPLNCDETDYKAMFYKEFSEKAAAKGIKLTA